MGVGSSGETEQRPLWPLCSYGALLWQNVRPGKGMVVHVYAEPLMQEGQVNGESVYIISIEVESE